MNALSSSWNITTQYGEVFWTMMDEVKLPQYIVTRFANKTMAVTGYEADSVRQRADGTEEHVPLYDQYNHHRQVMPSFCIFLTRVQLPIQHLYL